MGIVLRHPPNNDAQTTNSFLPCEEAGAFVWIWMGDPEAIDREPPDVAYQVDKDWSFITGYMEVTEFGF